MFFHLHTIAFVVLSKDGSTVHTKFEHGALQKFTVRTKQKNCMRIRTYFFVGWYRYALNELFLKGSIRWSIKALNEPLLERYGT